VEAPGEVAQPAPPVAEEEAAAPVVTEAAPAAVAPAPAPEAPASPPVVVPGAVTAPAAPEAGDNQIALSEAADPAPAGARVASPAAPGADAAPGAVAEPPAAPAAEVVVVEPPAAPEAPATAESAAEPEAAAPEVAQLPAPADAPSGGMAAGTAPAPGFGNADGVRVNRLPRIGDPEPAAEAAAEEAVPEEAVVEEDVPALVGNAVAFDNPEGRPVVAVVLLHDQPVAPGAETGLDLPVPVSFAVDAGLVEAGSVADAYRAGGREVLLVPTLPPGAAASDVEVALQVNLDVIPEAVAIMDLPEGGFQSEREAVAQVVSAITQTGHGLVTFPKGLNMAQQMADRAGVAARPVFRMLEAGDADAALRTLDQAAFRARQEGAVILVGRAEPATVEAIRRWAEANPDGEILLAPVSAALGAPE
jgi:polysaccharide deacetylase 2 family uncharacterized protein YibQ